MTKRKGAKLWGYYFGITMVRVTVVAIPASIIVAVWSGDWRWLFLTAACGLFIRSVLKHG